MLPKDNASYQTEEVFMRNFFRALFYLDVMVVLFIILLKIILEKNFEQNKLPPFNVNLAFLCSVERSLVLV